MIGKGGFGTIYNFNNLHAIKNVRFTKLTKDSAIKKAIEEYCLYQISSALQIGPKITQLFGFDLIIYENCVEFTMEKCSRSTSLNKDEILKSIKALHEFKIIHGDIKEDNIMYSQVYKKNVLIDFNCSSVIGENVG